MGTQAGNGQEGRGSNGSHAESAERQTRYHVTAKNKQPPSLEAVLRTLGKAVHRTGTIKQPDDVRGIFKSVHKEYADRGAADDFYRFLRNQRVLVRDGEEGDIYVDKERGQLLIAACEQGVRLPKVDGPAAQLAVLKAGVLQRRERPSSPDVQTGVHALPAEDGVSMSEEQQQAFAKMLTSESDEALLHLQASIKAKLTVERRQLLEVLLEDAAVDAEFARREEVRLREVRRRALEEEAARRRSELDALESRRSAQAKDLARLEADIARLAAQG